MAGESPTCFTLPAVTTSNYQPQGKYQKVNGLDVYVTGSQDSTKAILHVYDIFGIMPQTLQGADRLATALGILVIMPDWFQGEPMKSEWMPPDTEEKQALVDKFRTERSGNPHNFKILIETAEEAKKVWSGVNSWGAFGLCWGGKLAVLASGPNTLFKVSGQAHPSRLAKSDAEALTIPHIALMSNGEPADLVAEYEEVFSRPGKIGQVEKYLTMHHGWMGGRANLDNPDNLKEYERGYDQVARFFAKYL